jgi:hypothetical protein
MGPFDGAIGKADEVLNGLGCVKSKKVDLDAS